MPSPVNRDLRRTLRGVMVPLITPFAPSLEIDWLAFEAHIRRLLAHGVKVLIPADLVGEAWALTFDEKVMLFERTVHLAAGETTVIAKLSELTLPDAPRFAQAARAAAVDAVKIALPAWPGNEEATYEYVQAVMSTSGLPYLVEMGGAGVSVGVLDRLIKDPRFVGIEETSLDLDRFDDLVQRYGSRVPVIGGSEDVVGFTLLLGAAGFMTATPNFAPGFMGALWGAGSAGDASTTLSLYRRLRRYRRLFSAELQAGQPMFVTYTKAALELLGHRVGPPRPPLRSLTTPEKDTLEAVLRDAMTLEPHEGGTSC